MTRPGYVTRLLRSILPAVVPCALLVIATACGTNGARALRFSVAGMAWWALLAFILACDMSESLVPEATPLSEESMASGNTLVNTLTDASKVESSETVDGGTPVLTPTTKLEEEEDEWYGSVYPNIIYTVPPSLDELIFSTDVIIRATLKSATSTTETITGAVVSYRPVHELRFTVHEYLKGSGPSEALVVVRGERTYSIVAEAREVADGEMANRTTAWDNLQAVLFLQTLDGSEGWLRTTYTPTNKSGVAEGVGTTKTFRMKLSSADASAWDYTVDTMNRAWFPVAAGSTEGAASGSASVVFNTGGSPFVTDGGSTDPRESVTLGELKSRIAKMAATLKAGEGVAGYEDCIDGKLYLERINRANGSPWRPLWLGQSLASGLAKGTEIFGVSNAGELSYSRHYLTGRDKDYFQVPIVDEDSDSSDGYSYMIATARPLPAGTYNINHHTQHHRDFPCNFVSDTNYAKWTVTVTAPSGTVHEAFFDPASTFLGVGASGGQGVISPASFNVGGATTTITRIVVSFGSMVSMQVSPSVSLSGKHIEFIKVDGTVAARLSFDAGDLKGGIGIGGAGGTGTSTAEAAVSAEAHAEIAAAMAEAQAAGSKMYFWFVSSAPWQAGDKLMLRIR